MPVTPAAAAAVRCREFFRLPKEILFWLVKEE
jgi:hypothetical protein